MATGRRKLRSELYESWNRKLYQWWRYYNEEFAEAALQDPLILLSHGEEILGKWDGGRRQLSISVRHIEKDPWLEVMETLRHEMAHQYVYEVVGDRYGKPHGPSFQAACQRFRCSPNTRAQHRRSAAAGETDRHAAANDHQSGEQDRILRILKKTLSLAASPNENEAQAAVKKARRLLLQYNIDVVELDEERSFSVRRLGPTKGRRASYELWLALLLQKFFFVEVLWVFDYEAKCDKSGTVLQIHGTEANLDMAEYVYVYLGALVERLWSEYRIRRELDSNRERQRYYAGVLEGFHRKLREQERRVIQERALVWQGDSRLKAFYSYLNPRVRSRRGRGVAASDAYNHGLEAGKRVQIHRPIAESGGAGGLLEGGDR